MVMKQIGGVGLLVLMASAAAQEIQVERYSTLAERSAPTPASVRVADPLETVVTVRFTDATVGAAVQHLLADSGYRLAAAAAADPAQAMLLAQPLPAVQRTLGPVRLTQALITLAGPGFRLVLDRLHRLVSFEAAPAYAAYQKMPPEAPFLTPAPVTTPAPVAPAFQPEPRRPARGGRETDTRSWLAVALPPASPSPRLTEWPNLALTPAIPPSAAVAPASLDRPTGVPPAVAGRWRFNPAAPFWENDR
ncbi:MAG: hypothetical protein U1F76_22960 [Candidatus Competibacteraceae bacterium]